MPGSPKSAFHVRRQKKAHHNEEDKTADCPRPTLFMFHSFLLTLRILVFLPWWAVQFRRLHDTDRSAWWALLFLIPFIGWLIIIVFNCQAGTPGENRFGPDPKLEP